MSDQRQRLLDVAQAEGRLTSVVGAVLAARGRSELKKSNPQLPKTQRTLKEDAAWVKAQKN